MSEQTKDDGAGLIHQPIPDGVETEPRLTSHTPGPWDDASNYPEFASVRIFAGSHYIATVGNSDDTKAQTEANAHLIAAAPELYEALTAVMAQFDAGYFVRNIESDGQPDWAIKAARSVRTLASAVQALAKAEGRS